MVYKVLYVFSIGKYNDDELKLRKILYIKILSQDIAIFDEYLS